VFGVPHFQHAWFASGFLLVDEESLHCVRLVCMQRQYRRARYLGQCFRPQACCTLAAPGSKADLKTANVRRETFGKRESGRSSIHIFDDGHLLKSAGWVHPLEAHSLDNQYIYVCVSMCVCIMYIYIIYIYVSQSYHLIPHCEAVPISSFWSALVKNNVEVLALTGLQFFGHPLA